MIFRNTLTACLSTCISFGLSVSQVGAQEATTVWEPQVVFSADQHRTCTIDVGDQLPNTTLTNLTGGEVALSDSLGDGLTVIAFWDDQRVGGIQIRNRIVEILSNSKADLISIFVGQDIEAAKKILETDPDGTATHLIDDGTLWNQAAKKTFPPRIMLLKGQEVIWLDIEYSLDAQREMLNAIRYHSKASN